jgi:hypothetical protein
MTSLYSNPLLVISYLNFKIGPFIGSWVARTERLLCVKIAIAMNNLSICCSAIAAFFLLKKYVNNNDDPINQDLPFDSIDHLCISVIFIFGILEIAFSQARRIAIEMDWAVVICDYNEEQLGLMNTTLKSITFGCKLWGPIPCGMLLGWIGVKYGALFMCIWNILSGLLELFLITKVYNWTPKLLLTKRQLTLNQKLCGTLISGWTIYIHSPVFLAGVALALPYISVLSWSDILVSYLVSKGDHFTSYFFVSSKKAFDLLIQLLLLIRS